MLPRAATPRQMDVLAACVAVGGSVPEAAALVGIRPSTAKRHLADLRARSGLSTEQLIHGWRAAGWPVVPRLKGSCRIRQPSRVRLAGEPGSNLALRSMNTQCALYSSGISLSA